MKLNDPINIMLGCCIPDKQKLLSELGRLGPGETLTVRIDNCIASRAMVESYLRHKWYRIVDVVELDDASILSIRMDRDA
jgi:hypothetical protein